MGFGGYHPYPRRFGGGKPLLKVYHDSLNAARGSSIDAANAVYANIETMAWARAIVYDGVHTNNRMALQRDPDRMTDMLARWEAILGINPTPGATDYDRRRIVRRRRQRFLQASALHSRILTVLTNEVGECFSAVEYISIDNAVVHVPDGTYPFGTYVPGVTWYSSVAHMLVLLVKPAGYSEADFYAAAAKVAPAIDGIMPSWMTWDWYRAPANGRAITVTGGPSQGGFYLDDDHNLDNNVFDE